MSGSNFRALPEFIEGCAPFKRSKPESVHGLTAVALKGVMPWRFEMELIWTSSGEKGTRTFSSWFSHRLTRL
jgi:hypothetical protein